MLVKCCGIHADTARSMYFGEIIRLFRITIRDLGHFYILEEE